MEKKRKRFTEVKIYTHCQWCGEKLQESRTRRAKFCVGDTCRTNYNNAKRSGLNERESTYLGVEPVNEDRNVPETAVGLFNYASSQIVEILSLGHTKIKLSESMTKSYWQMGYDELRELRDSEKTLVIMLNELSSEHEKIVMKLEHLMRSYIEATITGYVYLMREKIGGLYKIGYSNEPEKRMNTLNTLPYDVVELIHKIPTNNHQMLEADFHGWFSHKRVKGEWFELDEKDIEFIKSHERMYYYE